MHVMYFDVYANTDRQSTLLLDYGGAVRVHGLYYDVGGLFADNDTVFAERKLSPGNTCSDCDVFGVGHFVRCALP